MTPSIIISKIAGRNNIGQRALKEIAIPRYKIFPEMYWGLREYLIGPCVTRSFAGLFQPGLVPALHIVVPDHTLRMIPITMTGNPIANGNHPRGNKRRGNTMWRTNPETSGAKYIITGAVIDPALSWFSWFVGFSFSPHNVPNFSSFQGIPCRYCALIKYKQTLICQEKKWQPRSDWTMGIFPHLIVIRSELHI